MTSKKSYSRYFIILQEDERGYGLSPSKTPTGYAKMEIKNSKCKVSYYVQNLKTDSNKYCMMLICGKKGCQNLINIGCMNLDDQGRADVSYEYDMDNIGTTNISVDKVIGACITKVMSSNVISIMSGFTTTDIPKDWKTYTVIDVNTKREEEANIFEEYEKSIEYVKGEEKHEENEKVQFTEAKVEEKVENEVGEKTLEVNKQEIEEAKERNTISKDTNRNDSSSKEEDKQKNIEENPKEKRIELEEKKCEEQRVGEEPQKEKIQDIRLEEVRDKKCNCEKCNNEVPQQENQFKIYKEYNDELDREIEQMDRTCCSKGEKEEFFDKIAEKFEKYYDIFPKVKKSVWYKVPVKCMEDVCDMSNYDRYVVMYYPMISYYSYIKDYGHYLVGYKYDENCKLKYIMYAIPGDKSPKCQPFGGKTGFVTWMSNYNSDKSQGYWMMFYDFKNSNVLIPIKKKK